MKDSSAPADGRATRPPRRVRVLRTLAAVFAAALTVRLWGLGDIPPGFYLDEGVYGLAAADILDGTDRPSYFNRLWGVDAMYAYLAAGSFRIFGESVASLRLISAFAGAACVAGIFLAAFELFRRKKDYSRETDESFAYRAAFAAAFVAAFSRWHITFSRIAFQGILLPAVSSFAFYFLYRAFDNLKPRAFALSGFFFGAVFYTYLPSRFVPFAALFALICEIARIRYSGEGERLPALARGAVIMAAAAILASLPLWLHFVRYPEFFSARARAVFDGSSPAVNFVKSALMFGFEGDANPRHNIPAAPMFSVGLFILFAGGAVLGAKNIIYGPRRFAPAFLFFWFAAMFLPAIFSSEAPHALRTIGVLPPTFILCGYFAAALYGPSRRPSKLKTAAVVLFLASTAFVETRNYFYVWAPSARTRAAFGEWQVEVLRRAGGFLTENDVFLPVSFLANPAVTFLARAEFGSRFRCVSELRDFVSGGKSSRGFIYASSRLSRSDFAVEEAFARLYPSARLYAVERSASGEPLFIYYRLTHQNLARPNLSSGVLRDAEAAMSAALAEARSECEASPWLRDQLKYCPVSSGAAAAGKH